MLASTQIHKLHQPQIEQLTGCRYAVFMSLVHKLRDFLQQPRRGRPFAFGAVSMVFITLMKIRQNLTVRSMEAITGMDAVTVSRCLNRVIAVIGQMPLAGKAAGLLVVDTSSIRVATTDQKSYSGHKHQRCAKVQVVARADGLIVDVGQSNKGSTHDKTIWNKEHGRLKHLFDQLVLADKAYAGAIGEGQYLLRPVKHNESAYRTAPDESRTFNKGLSNLRVRIEHVFARLNAWKTFSGLFFYKWQRLSEFVRAIAVVHNMNLQFDQISKGGAP